MALRFLQDKSKKPERWAFDRGFVDPEWGWLWSTATAVVPFWERAGDPRNLVTGKILVRQDVSTMPWGVGQRGPFGETTHTANYWTFGTASEPEITPRATHGTILLARRKTDATLRASTSFGIDSSLNCHLPWTDGKAYWDWGGSGAGQRISADGLSSAGFQAWAFVASPAGQAIYLDGILRASSSTASSRTVGTGDFLINKNSSASGDFIAWSMFAVLDTEATAGQIAQWSADPLGPCRRHNEVGVLSTLDAPPAGGDDRIRYDNQYSMIHSIQEGMIRRDHRRDRRPIR